MDIQKGMIYKVKNAIVSFADDNSHRMFKYSGELLIDSDSNYSTDTYSYNMILAITDRVIEKYGFVTNIIWLSKEELGRSTI